MSYWRFYVGFGCLIVALQFPGQAKGFYFLGIALVCLVWGTYHYIQRKKKYKKWQAEHPYTDPNYECATFDVVNTEVSDEEGDRQAALRRFFERSDEFEGEILGSLRPLNVDDYGDAAGYGIYLNETRVGDVPEDQLAFIQKRFRHLETFGKIQLKNWEEGSEGPLGLLVSLRFPRNKYDTTLYPQANGRLLNS